MSNLFDIDLVEWRQLSDGRRVALLKLTFAPGALQRTDTLPGFSKRLLSFLPQLRIHACHNDAHKSFSMELENTEVAHVFEHVVVELVAQLGRHPRSEIRGKTAWNFAVDGQGVYRVRIRGFDSRGEAREIACRARGLLQEVMC